MLGIPPDIIGSVIGPPGIASGPPPGISPLTDGAITTGAGGVPRGP
jgi:hypothetical protein